MHLPAFYINLDRDVARRAAIERELQQIGLKAERIAGVDGERVPPNLQPFFFENGVRVSRLSSGEVGCYASHLTAMQLILDRALEWALVIEDDVRLHSRLTDIVKAAIACAPSDWDFIKLCRYPPLGGKPIAKLAAGRTLVRYCRIPNSTGGYLVSKAGAKKLLARHPKTIPIDSDMRRPWLSGLEVFGVTPPVTPHDRTLPSSIETRGGGVKGRYKHTGRKQEMLYNYRRLGPLWLLRYELARWSEKKRKPTLSKNEQMLADAETALAWHAEIERP
jgi:glycosyl transferase family 25